MGSCFSAEGGSPRHGSSSSPGYKPRTRNKSKKRTDSRSYSSDNGREEPLHRIPGRMFLSGCSEVASLFTRQGKKGPNQDAMIVWENFCSRTDTIFCGVFDGHGPHGHSVAKRVRDVLPLRIRTHWKVNAPGDDVLKQISINAPGSMNSEDTAFIQANEESGDFIDLDKTERLPEIFHTLKDSFLKAFKVMDRELKLQGNIDCFFSGTTAVTLIKQGNHLVVGNVGDSRAVLGTRDDGNALIAVQLTVDLKPNLPAEAQRIKQSRGRVFALRDEPDVARVWLPNHDSPGLAMARAFGDFCLKDYGLIAVPDISYRLLSEKDKFVVLATDGIWDVLSNEEVVEIVASAPARSSAARTLVESAVKAWRYEYPTSKVDDCAVVCLFLDFNSDSISTASITNPNEQTSLLDAVELIDENGNPATGKQNVLQIIPEANKREQQLDLQDANLVSEYGTQQSVIEGVGRADSILNLPRFVPGR